MLWLEHLLLFSMLQHPSDNWTWGRYLVVHPAGNTDIVDLCGRYRTMLADDTTFTTMTLEQLLATGALPKADDRCTPRPLRTSKSRASRR